MNKMLQTSEIVFLFFIFFLIFLNIYQYIRGINSKKTIVKLEKDFAVLQQQNSFYEYQIKQYENHEKKLDEKLQHFLNGYAHDALLKNQTSFLEMAKTTFDQMHQQQKHELETKKTAISQMIDPVNQTLSKMEEKLGFLEKERAVAYSDLKNQVQSLIQTQVDLKQETSSLVKALRTPSTRGQWGEIQLKRVVELAGMIEHCDFVQQEVVDKTKLRPDMVVHLPGKKQVIVDAKTPLTAYLNALEEKDEKQKIVYLNDHARHVKTHIKQLSQKSYWDQFEASPEFVVMFLPSESLLSAALEQDPSLIEFGAQEKVIMATPTTLIALLRAIAYGWRQENIHDSIKNIIHLGQDLYKRFHIFSDYFSKLGRSLNQSVHTYNQTLSSIEGRLLPVMRKFQDVKSIKTEETVKIEPIDILSKELTATEFRNDD